MKIMFYVLLGLSATCASAQNINCTPLADREVCKLASYLGLFASRGGYDVTISDPVAFANQREVLQTEAQEKLMRDPKLYTPYDRFHNAYFVSDYSKDLLFVRGKERCPTRVFLSTDMFRPITIKKGKLLTTPGVDIQAIARTGAYVDGLIAGCKEGIGSYVADEINKATSRK